MHNSHIFRSNRGAYYHRNGEPTLRLHLTELRNDLIILVGFCAFLFFTN